MKRKAARKAKTYGRRRTVFNNSSGSASIGYGRVTTPSFHFARIVDDWTAICQQKTRETVQGVADPPPPWSQEDHSVIMPHPKREEVLRSWPQPVSLIVNSNARSPI